MKSTEQIGEIRGVAQGKSNGPDILIDDLQAFVHTAEEGGYWAEVPDLPGCVTEGEDLDELVANINDAINGWLSVQTHESLTALGVQYTELPEANTGAFVRHAPRLKTLQFAA